tara:strand:+ start:286654 stop:286830 length:177 start_codon:yes stop_codon:yes gene_type:complete
MEVKQPQIGSLDENKLEAIIENLGIPEISADVLRTAALGNIVLDELKTALDETEKPIH